LIPYGLRMKEGRWRMLESDLEKYMNSKEIR